MAFWMKQFTTLYNDAEESQHNGGLEIKVGICIPLQSIAASKSANEVVYIRETLPTLYKEQGKPVNLPPIQEFELSTTMSVCHM